MDNHYFNQEMERARLRIDLDNKTLKAYAKAKDFRSQSTTHYHPTISINGGQNTTTTRAGGRSSGGSNNLGPRDTPEGFYTSSPSGDSILHELCVSLGVAYLG